MIFSDMIQIFQFLILLFNNICIEISIISLELQ